ncbi:type III-A CRISPR-associated RAMP protein Csm3 [Tepidibacter thalassicus]|uniref:CRISPR system Cms endoribonuclease Csm3 n=1 Tax=Tepidibacter thalassicus DSM 15285 TaxID=1123350 RepID=A0A1M5TER7_9FIRM|nr:type III-A CRISPR-associated RAMP protein Csm3 [Tepidibacter thalassicus]SHH49161.1 CRISPR-associated protein Csm3 [Tepidibacter thalassicus DSM 15285]
MKLKGIKQIKGKIILLSGMAIGGNAANIEIGGNDNPIIRNPFTNEPYIPGSSIKGKLRTLTEWNLGKVENDGAIHSCKEKYCPVCTIFGRSAVDSREAQSGPTRLIVRDAYLTDDSKKDLEELRKKTGTDTEMKYENSINRITSIAVPRNIERVPAGIEFEFEMSYKIFDLDDGGKLDEQNFENVLKGLKLLSLDGIGGGVSRGNGHIKLEVYVDGQKIDIENINI